LGGKPITRTVLNLLCLLSNTKGFWSECHFIAAVLPPFTIFLVIEIRAKVKTGERKASARCRGFLFGRESGVMMDSEPKLKVEVMDGPWFPGVMPGGMGGMDY
jgi:hypothetical protein